MQNTFSNALSEATPNTSRCLRQGVIAETPVAHDMSGLDRYGARNEDSVRRDVSLAGRADGYGEA